MTLRPNSQGVECALVEQLCTPSLPAELYLRASPPAWGQGLFVGRTGGGDAVAVAQAWRWVHACQRSREEEVGEVQHQPYPIPRSRWRSFCGCGCGFASHDIYVEGQVSLTS
jgi:hypothetical protein